MKNSAAKGKVLLMDDEEIVAGMASRMLALLGYKVETAKNGREAIELYKKAKEKGYPFDVVILDLIVQNAMGGEDTVKELLKYDPDVKVIVSSGYSEYNIPEECKKSGFKAQINKPYSMEELDEVLREVLN